MEMYLPFTSSYTSTLSFSLNGLVPDDINNNFSNKKSAILEPIKYHLNEDFVNIDVIDTTIKGSIELSNEAILVIEDSYFNSLSDEVKDNLKKNFKIELFKGNLKDAINDSLIKYGYPHLNLIQRKSEHDMENNEYKESMIEFQKLFSEKYKVSRLKLQQLYMYPITSMSEIDSAAASKVKSDFDKNIIVQSYYTNIFYEFLLLKAENYGVVLTDVEKYYLFSNTSNSQVVLETLLEKYIKALGNVEKLKEIILEYNVLVGKNYKTNEEIIQESNRHFDK